MTDIEIDYTDDAKTLAKSVLDNTLLIDLNNSVVLSCISLKGIELLKEKILKANTSIFKALFDEDYNIDEVLNVAFNPYDSRVNFQKNISRLEKKYAYMFNDEFVVDKIYTITLCIVFTQVGIFKKKDLLSINILVT